MELTAIAQLPVLMLAFPHCKRIVYATHLQTRLSDLCRDPVLNHQFCKGTEVSPPVWAVEKRHHTTSPTHAHVAVPVRLL